MLSTGATGLEPATSGVTGHFQDRDMNDGGRHIAVFMRFLGSAPAGCRMVERNDLGGLLPVCCPNGTVQQGRRLAVGLTVVTASSF